MCLSCLVEYGALSPDHTTVLVEVTPEIWDLAGLIWDFYRLPGCSVGGPLHIVLDDTNVEDDHLDYCEREALPKAGWWIDGTDEELDRLGVVGAASQVMLLGRRIVAALRPLSLPQRALVTELADPYDDTRPQWGHDPR